MIVPAKRRLSRSPMGRSPGRGSTFFLVGTDSPVSIDSSASRFAASMIRASAGTRDPASRRMTSPGTSSLALIRVSFRGPESEESRRALASGEAWDWRARIASSALYSL